MAKPPNIWLVWIPISHPDDEPGSGTMWLQLVGIEATPGWWWKMGLFVFVSVKYIFIYIYVLYVYLFLIMECRSKGPCTVEIVHYKGR